MEMIGDGTVNINVMEVSTDDEFLQITEWGETASVWKKDVPELITILQRYVDTGSIEEV
tara:strand:+ start:281 stop:457 length:177 start_codon:yes stop_codon:yes gene_type:complete